MKRKLWILVIFLELMSCSFDTDFSRTADLSVPRHGHRSVLISPGKLLVIGGLTKEKPLNSIELFSSQDSTFRLLTTPRIKRRGWHQTVKLQNEKILVTGGWLNAQTALREAAILTPEGALEEKINMALARYDHTSTLLQNGEVLIAGGTDGKRTHRTMEIYLPSKKSFQYIRRPMLVPRQQHTATMLQDGRVLIAGGARGKGGRYAELYNSVEKRTQLVKSFLSAPRRRHTATPLQDGRVLIAGGLGKDAALSSAEVFDPQTEKFRSVGRMSVSRQQHTATLLPDGRVLILGGWGGEGKTLASGELFDPKKNCFARLRSSMKFERRFHTATRIDKNRVLVIGGASDREVLQGNEYFHLSDDPLPCPN